MSGSQSSAALILALLAALLVSRVISSDVSWFLHLSDLHLSIRVADRASDLESLIKDQLPKFNFSNILITGDIVDAKKRFRRSRQYIEEWEMYDNVIHLSHLTLGTSESSFLDIPGNHDSFDTGLKGGLSDYYTHFGVQGLNWSTNNILIHPFGGAAACPVYCLVGIDVAPEIGLRSPTNFFGIVSDAILRDLESALTEDMKKWYSQDCHPVYLAYGHYPLSMIGVESGILARRQEGLKRTLLKYGVSGWLCGHLHDEFGNHLFKVHSGDAARLLELEMTDWKFERRFRILAVDDGHLSALDLAMEEGSVPAVIRPLSPEIQLQGAAILMTSPPTPYFAPLNRAAEPISAAHVRALVWPMEETTQSESLTVQSAVFCGVDPKPHVFPMHPASGSAVYESDVEMGVMARSCHEGAQVVQVQVQVLVNGSDRVSWSEKREIEDRPQPQDYPHSLLEVLILTVPWCAFFQDLFVLMILFHISILLVLPKALSYLKSFQIQPMIHDGAENGHKRSKWRILLLGPVHAFAAASRFPVFWWGQLCFSVLLLFGPWSFARVLDGESLGILFLNKVYIKLKSEPGFQVLYSQEMPFRGCFFYLSCMLPWTIWMVWAFHRMKAKANGSTKRDEVALFFYAALFLVCLASFARSAVFSQMYYGAWSVFLSPLYVGWIGLNAWAFYAAMRSIPKSRQE